MTPYTRTSILVAEDSAVIQIVLREMLTHWGYNVELVADGASAWEVLRVPSRPRLAIVDWMIPGLKGTDLCRRLRAENPEPYTYILMLTSRSAAADIAEGFNSGVDDYLTKPFHAQELWARIRAGARILRVQQELAETREALRVCTTKDHLTGLINRSVVLRALDDAWERAEREGQPLSILRVTIDRFRQINDSFGRLAGDAVLRQCAARLQAVKPEGATLGRYSGKRFLIVLPGVNKPQAAVVAEQVRAAVSAESIQAGAASFPVTCSTGIATRDVTDSGDAASLIRATESSFVAAAVDEPEGGMSAAVSA